MFRYLIHVSIQTHGVGAQVRAILKEHNLDAFRQFIDRITELGVALFEFRAAGHQDQGMIFSAPPNSA